MDTFVQAMKPYLTSLKETEITWIPFGVQPPDRKDTPKNREHVQSMLSAIFLSKYPEVDAGFVIGWNPERKQFKIGLHLMPSQKEPKVSVLES
jgi:hypothetical protein